MGGIEILVALAVGILLFAVYVIKGDRAYRQKLAAYRRAKARIDVEQRLAIANIKQQPAAPPARLPTLSTFLALTPTQFEIAVGGLFEASGYTNIQHTGGGGDLMADLTCVTPNGFAAVVQCKQYRPDHTVGSPAIQAFIGMAYRHHRVSKAIFVTTSTFTEPARVLARQHNIELIDGQQLIQMVETANTRFP